MRISTPTLISSAITAAAIAVAPAAHAGPTVGELCDAQSWPRPVPDVVGMMFDPSAKQIPAGVGGGALACWDNIRGVTGDGQDASKEMGGWDTITAVSPPPGTPVGRHDPITVQLAPINYDAPQSVLPCDWVTTSAVADIFGITGPIETDGYVQPGSVTPDCVYRSPGHTAVAATLYMTGAFPVDAAAEYAMHAAESPSETTEISGLGLAARCLTNLHGAQDSHYNEVVVLLDGNRLFEAKGLGAQPCSQLTQFAKTAIEHLVTATASPATDPTAVTHGVEGSVADVPWSEVGPGWTLATWSPVTPHMRGNLPAPGEPTWETASTTLYLVNPSGDRYAIKTFPVGETPDLIDWSGDGGHALIGQKYPAPDSVTLVDLHTGGQTTIDVNGHPRFAGPDGKALLVSTDDDGGKPGTLKRIDLDGNLLQTYPIEKFGGTGHFTGSHIESPDGTRLVLGTDTGLVAMRNDGSGVRALAKPPIWNAECKPVRWWTAGAILARCDANRGSATQLWTVPLDGSAAIALTAPNSGRGGDPGFGGDLGDGVAWQLPGGTFLQSAGACGTMFLSRLTADGHTTRVDVPGMSDSVRVVGVSGDKLDLLGKVGCGGTTSLVSYEPATNFSTVLLGPPVNGGGVTGAIPYSGRNYHEHTETARYTIDITYALDYPDRKAVSDFVSADRGYFLDWIDRFGSDRPARHYMYDVDTTTYSSTRPATTSLVLTIDHDTGSAHEAHPSTTFEAFTYDLTEKAPITLDALFKPDADVVSVLGPRVQALYDRPTFPLMPSDFRNFAVTDDAVIFFFGEGQLIPADNTGPRQISVPRSELAPLLA